MKRLLWNKFYKWIIWINIIIQKNEKKMVYLSDSNSYCSGTGTVNRFSLVALTSWVGFQNTSRLYNIRRCESDRSSNKVSTFMVEAQRENNNSFLYLERQKMSSLKSYFLIIIILLHSTQNVDWETYKLRWTVCATSLQLVKKDRIFTSIWIWFNNLELWISPFS